MADAGKPAEIEFVVPDPDSGLFASYANHVQVGFTAFDIRLLFGEVVDVQPNKVTIEQRASITMAWLQAKILKQMLERIISDYEARNGELKVPTGAVELTANVPYHQGPIK